jgi:peptidoglycan-N-acetylglucosamine deacetylase
VKVTFFMLGELVKTQPALAKKVKEAGHEVGSHTYTHKNYKSRLKELIQKFGESRERHPKAEQEVRQELLSAMRKAKSVTESAIGSKIYLCRMPHGIDAPWVRETGHEAGLVLVNWTYGADWTYASPGDLIKSYTNAIRPGAILLLHDGGVKREKTIAITEAVIKAAREKGYSIVPVGQLLGIPAN